MKELHIENPFVGKFIADAVHHHDGEQDAYGEGTSVLQLVVRKGRRFARLWEPGDRMPFGGDFRYEDFFLPEELAEEHRERTISMPTSDMVKFTYSSGRDRPERAQLCNAKARHPLEACGSAETDE